MAAKKILLVDDSRVASMTQALILEKRGDYEIRTASDGMHFEAWS